MNLSRFLNAFPQTLQLLFKEIYSGLKDSQIQLLTSSLAFTTLFALVPLIAVFLSAFKLFGGFQPLLETFEPMIMNYLAPGSGETVVGALRTAISRADPNTVGFTGIFFLLVSTTRLMIDVENAFQKIWRAKKQRSWASRIVIYWGLIFFAPLCLAIGVGFLSAQSLLSLSDFNPAAMSLISLFLTLVILYKVIPPTTVNIYHALIAAGLATLSILIAKEVYRMATTYMITYNKIYGSLASIPFFLLWLVIVWWIILGCAILAAAIKQRAITAEKLGLKK